ncbi:MAG TPA: hypothetical protein VFN13_00515 [Rudaea sp.]|nr:hypothetical protein [Rudaea sp.]
MKKFIEACIAIALLGFACNVLASPTIELKDGSRIQGEIQGIDNGVYTVVSPSIGTVHVAQSNIVRIIYGADASNAAPSSDKSPARNDTLSRDIEQLQTRLVQDPATMQSIMSLASDPQIQTVLNDPAIIKAIQDGDYASLLDNAKIQALENNPRLKQLIQQQEH